MGVRGKVQVPLSVVRYAPQLAGMWNTFVAQAKNATFLFDRGYMDYHADRFKDHSILILEDGAIVAAFPANETEGGRVVSHGGLTFGGLAMNREVCVDQAIRHWVAFCRYYRDSGFREILYKQVPAIYCDPVAHEDDYFLFHLDARLVRRDLSFVIDSRCRLPYQKRRERMIAKGRKSDVEIRESRDFAPFWDEVLRPNLKSRFGTEPVHSRDEMSLLASRFPTNIRMHEAWMGGKIVAGAVIFVTPRVAHSQYISASPEGRDSGAVDLLFADLVETVYRSKDYFSFGTSNEIEGRQVNAGLADWKEGFGARAHSKDFYLLELTQAVDLDLGKIFIRHEF